MIMKTCQLKNLLLVICFLTITSTAATAKPQETKAAPSIDLNVQTWQTANAIPVYFVKRQGLPILDLQLTCNAGGARDGKLPGLAYLTNQMLTEGTKQHEASEIARLFESTGAKVSLNSYRDMAIINLRALTDENSLHDNIKLLNEILLHATFPEESIKLIKQQLLAAIEYENQSPAKIAEKKFYEVVYAKHPYGQSIYGTRDSLAAIKRSDIQHFFQQYYVANNCVIALVGDFSEEFAKSLTETLTHGLAFGEKSALLAEPAATKAFQQAIDYPSTQTSIILGRASIDRLHPDYPALYLANTILGGNPTNSLLGKALRNQHGLTYNVDSDLIPMQTHGPLLIKLQTRVAETALALSLIKKTLQDFQKNSVSDEELSQTKQHILGTFAFGLAQNDYLVAYLSSLAFYQLPLEYPEKFLKQISAVTAQDIQSVVKKYFDLQHFVTITVGKTNE